MLNKRKMNKAKDKPIKMKKSFVASLFLLGMTSSKLRPSFACISNGLCLVVCLALDSCGQIKTSYLKSS